MRNIFVYFIILGSISACHRAAVVHPSDYQSFFDSNKALGKKINASRDECIFWERKLKEDTGSYVYMQQLSFAHIALFGSTGEVAHLLSADSLLQRASTKINNTEPGLFFALSQNSITCHHFAKAYNYVQKAKQLHADSYISSLLDFDASLELGYYKEAAQSLESLKDKKAFDYLVRKAKILDHAGDLNGAIVLMETALAEAKDAGRQKLINWTQTNLSDMYGHAGRITDAYHGYLAVLKTDPADLFSWKGIAWIAFSHDKNTAEARRIYKWLAAKTQLPDHYLALAEIAAYEKNWDDEKKWTTMFETHATSPAYGDMYNKYLIRLYAGILQQPQRAVILAQKELNNRRTPETTNWLAWTYFKAGNLQKAKELVNDPLNRVNHEPTARMNNAIILASTGETRKAAEILNSVRENAFELGPVVTATMEDEMRKLSKQPPAVR